MNLEYINIQTNEKLETYMLEGLKDNAMLKVRPELWTEWDFKKNDELGFNIFGMTKGSEKRAWWICGACMSEWDATIINRCKGRGCPYCAGRRVNHTNSLASLNPKLAKEWHPTLNDKTPHEVSCLSGEKIWWFGKCGHEWDATIANRTNGKGCPYCRGLKVNHTNSLASLNPKLAKEWHPTLNDNKPNNVPCGSNQKVWWLGECGHEWEAVIANRTKGVGCPYCSKYGKNLLIGHNDMWTTNPNLAKLLANHDDGYKYTQSSGEKVDWKCKECGNIIEGKIIFKIKEKGLSCTKCSDGISYPEKIMYNLLKTLNVDFIKELTSKNLSWVDSKQYDFYIPSLNLIIETHGIQHYENSFERLSGRTLEEECKNDLAKRELALSNGISYYIELDCKESSMEYIRNSILNSELTDMLNLDNVDWEDVALQSEKSLVFEICDMWNEGMSVHEIIEKALVSGTTIRSYLARGSSLGICDYSKSKAHARGISKRPKQTSTTNKGGIYYGECY